VIGILELAIGYWH